MKKIKEDDIASFAEVVAKVWSDKGVEKRYHSEPHKVLAEYGITLPSGVPIPPIPPRPKGAGTPALGEEFKNLTFEHWELTVRELPGAAQALTRTGGSGGGEVNISVSSLACAACPVSCFSSLSN